MALTPEEQAELEALEQDPEVQNFMQASTQTPNAIQSEAVSTSMPEAFARGVAQGASFGFSDELTAGAEGALKYIQGEEFGPSYEQALKESQAEYDKSEQEYPITSAIGGIGGAVGQTVGLSALTGGAAGAAGAGKAAQALSKLKSLLNPTSKAGFFKNVGTMAKAGAAQGAATAVGRSKKDGLERFEDAPEGVISGAVVGGGLAAVGAGLGKAASAVGSKISKGIDEGKYPTFVRMIREGIRTGKEGRGFSTEAGQQQALNEVYDIAENTVKPEITNALSDIRELRNYIIDNTDGIVDISVPIKALNKGLKSIGFQDAEDLRSGIKKAVDLAKSKGFLSVADANRVAKSISDEIQSKPQYSAEIKKLAYTTINDIKNQVRLRIPNNKAVEILESNPEMLAKYMKYVQSMSPEDLADTLKTSNLTDPKQALKKAKEIRKVVKSLAGAFSEEDPSLVASIVADPSFKEVLRLTNPIKTLDDKMHQILNASEILGDVTISRSEAESIDAVTNIFRNLVDQPKDGTTALLAKKRFEAAMANLNEAIPDVAKKIEDRVTPVLKDIQFQRYIEGSGFDKGAKESGFIKGTLKDVGRIAAEGANVVGQISKAATEGTRGPLPLPTSTLLRPSVSMLTSIKKVADDVQAAHPNSNMWKFISETTAKALSEKDEGRRAAILNTLMQYKTFRDLFDTTNKEGSSSGEE